MDAKLLLRIIFFLSIVVAMYFAQSPLTNGEIVELELCFSESNYAQILAQIGVLKTSKFAIHVAFDFFLMLGYVFLLKEFIQLVKSKKGAVKSNWATALIFTAGALDAIEDVLMYQRICMNNTMITPYYWSIVSSIKFGLILLVIVYVLYYLLSPAKTIKPSSR